MDTMGGIRILDDTKKLNIYDYRYIFSYIIKNGYSIYY